MLYVVSGESMKPTYMHGQRIIALKTPLARIKKDIVVIAKDPRNGRLLLKRVRKVEKYQVFLLGDNEKESTDSRDFGWVKKEDILARIIYPKA